MAYERTSDTKVRGDSLDSFVENISKTLQRQTAIRNADDEMRFNKAVLEENLPLEDQLTYREQQLKRVSDDPTEKNRVKGEISALKDRVEQKKFSDSYLEKLIGYSSGVASIDSVIEFLEEQKLTATDPTVKSTIDQEIVSKKADKFTITKNIIMSRTEYAINDKTDSVLNDQIGKVSSEKAKALLAGNKDVAASLDLQLQALNKAKTEAQIEKDTKNFAVSTLTNASSATKLLDAYNSKIKDASGTGPVSIGGVTYSSAEEFWTYKRDNYIADQGADGFFSRVSSEITQQIKVANSKNSLTTDLLKRYTKDLKKLTSRPELSGFDLNIDAALQDALQTGGDLLAGTISNRYTKDYDLGKAISSINSVKALGINVDDAYTKLITKGSEVKQNQVDGILRAAQAALENDPSLTPEQALQQAMASGAGAVLSPDELAKEKESDIVGEFARKSKAGEFTNDPRTTTDPDDQPQATERSTGFKTITVRAGESLSAIAARELGSASKYMEIASANNIANPNKISVGQVLKIPIPQTSAPKSNTSSSSSSRNSSSQQKKNEPAKTSTNRDTSSNSDRSRNKNSNSTPAPAPKIQKATPVVQTTPSNYTIRSGDSLSKIASQYGTSVAKLAQLNNIKDPNKIFAGATIKVR
jgi:nucleoid-associated protein YgaU